MTLALITIKLSSNEIDFLCNAGFLDIHQIEFLRGAQASNDTDAVLRITRDLAEEFRDAFTIELAKVGFDANYDLTPEGRVIEDLIDRFYVVGN